MTFGIMQGRLTPSNGRGIQFFPFENWRQEFTTGKELGLDEIEWIFDYDQYERNPLWSQKGIEDIKSVIANTGVRIRSVCFDYFMRRPFFRQEEPVRRTELREENIRIIQRVISNMTLVGAELIEIPLVDDSSIKNDETGGCVREFIREAADCAAGNGILVGLETDLPPGKFREYLDSIDRGNMAANYDSGNSSGLGYDHEEELLSLSELVANVHIKDRMYKGTTVELGTGSADFDKLFSSLKKIGYHKSIVLQAARNDEKGVAETIRSQISFVKAYCKKYGLEA